MNPTSIHRLDFESKAATTNTPAIRKKLPESYVDRIRITIEYIQFLEATGNDALVDDPTQWVMRDFKAWIRNGKPTSIINPNPPLPVTPNPAPATTTAAAPFAKNIQDETLMNWNPAKRSTSDYPVLTSDRDYTSWRIKMNRQATLDRILRLIDPNF